jgi:hypothetical protein
MVARMEKINIVFITACFELGKDGVADYTYALAKACQKEGNNCAVVAWNDPFLSNLTWEDGLIGEGEVSIPFRRISSGLTSKEKEELAKSFLEKYKPNFVSIQMVCFGFHPRGWIFGLGRSFRKVIPRQIPLEIMFHELWLGLAINHPWKEKFLGTLQRMALTQFWKTLKPQVVHVGNNIYYSKLLSTQLSVKCLPIPSNIPYQENQDSDWVYQALSMKKGERTQSLFLVFFGTLHSGWETESFWEKIIALSKGKKIYALSIGSMGYGTPLWEKMRAQFEHKIRFVALGYQSSMRVSSVLQISDAGISTTPLSLIGKSGSAMAMIEHGLPIIVTRDELKFEFPLQRIEEKYPQVFMWDQLDTLDSLVRQPVQANRTESIVSKFLEDVYLSLSEINP